MVYNYVRLESSTAEISVDLVMVLHLFCDLHFTYPERPIIKLLALHAYHVAQP